MPEIPAALKDRFVDDVLSCLTSVYQTPDKTETFQGQSVSYLLSQMRDYDKRWRGLGSLGDFEGLLERTGFVIRRGQMISTGSGRRGPPARVVTL